MASSELLSLIEAAISNSPYLPWFCGCEYQCRLCEEESNKRVIFYSVGSLRGHIETNHGSLWDYILRTALLETKTVIFECKLCDERNIKKNFEAIKAHMVETHPDTSMERYQKMYGENYDSSKDISNEDDEPSSLFEDCRLNEINIENLYCDEKLDVPDIDERSFQELVKVEITAKDENIDFELESEIKEKPSLASPSDSKLKYSMRSKIKTPTEIEKIKFELLKHRTCDKCNFIFKTRIKLKAHLENHYKQEEDLLMKQPESECEYIKSSIFQEFTCHLCQEIFRNTFILRVHIGSHSGEKPHKCDFCDKTFNQKSAKTRHMTRLHTQSGIERKFKCHHCSLKFVCKAEIEIHFKQAENKKEYECKPCDISFKSLAHLTRHQKRSSKHKQKVFKLMDY